MLTKKCLTTGHETIYNRECDVILLSNQLNVRCMQCSRFRSTMQVRKSRLQETSAQKVQINSSVRYSLLTKEEMMKRMKILHNEMIKIKKQRDRLMEKSEELDKHVLLLLDEMHIKEDLDKHSGNNNYVAFLHYNNYKILGELIGFINLGDIKEHLQVLENTLTETSVPR